MNQKKSITEKIILYMFLTLLAFVTLFPLIYIAVSSFKTNSEILAHPENIFPMQPTLDNFKIALTSEDFNLPLMFRNSVLFTLANVIINLFVSSCAGYSFARGNYPFKKVIFVIFSSLMFINIGSITIYALFEILNVVNLSQSLLSLVIIRLFSIPIINIYLVKSYITTLPYELDEAAKIDGCNFINTFFKVIAPLLKPLFATIGLLAFQSSWNEYLMPTIFTLTRPSQRTIIVGVMALKNSGESAANWNLMLAGSTVAIVPVLIAYAFANKYFIKGMVAGAVKG